MYSKLIVLMEMGRARVFHRALKGTVCCPIPLFFNEICCIFHINYLIHVVSPLKLYGKKIV